MFHSPLLTVTLTLTLTLTLNPNPNLAKQSACIALYYCDAKRSGTYSLYLG